MNTNDARFVNYDPEWCTFFVDAVRRTIADRQTNSSDAEVLMNTLKMLPEAQVLSRCKQGRSIIFEFEADTATNEARSILLLGGPNYKRRMCVIDVAPDGTPLSAELAQ